MPDHFGRPQRRRRHALVAVPSMLVIAGSLWPPRTRSATPPLDGLALYTPADVFFGRVDELAGRRQRALDRVFEAHPERFVRGRPITHRPPAVVSIDPIAPEPLVLTAEQFLEAGDEELESRAPLPSPSSTPYMSLPGVQPLLGVDVPTPVDLERS